MKSGDLTAVRRRAPVLPPPPTPPKRLRRPIRDLRPGLEAEYRFARAARSRSNGSDRRIPLQPDVFVKEPLNFSLFNPQSISSQKYLQFSREISAQPPELFRN